MTKGSKTDLIRQFVERNPDVKGMGDRTIAGIMLSLHPEFGTLEKARSLVRIVMGHHGERIRTSTKDPEKVKFFFHGFPKWVENNLNTEVAPWDEPFVFPKFKHLSLIADIHSIHMDPDVMTAFLRSTKDREAVILNGDLFDSESLTRHIKSKNWIAYETELEICHQILKGLTEEFDHVYFREGNHDFWLERYLLTQAPALAKVKGIDIKTLLRCDELGVTHIHNLKYWNYGDLDGIHGHEFPGFGMGKFPAVGLVDKWQTFKGVYDVKVICSHCHIADEAISRRSKDGKFGYGWVTPAFCRKAASYAPFAGRNQGWVDLSINNDGQTEVSITVL